MAGIGAAINTGGVGRGDSVAVIGCGGVGGAAIAGARLAGAATDHRRGHRRPQARRRRAGSAPRTPSTPATTDAVEAIRELTGGFGADVVIDAVGRPETYKQAFYARDLAGTVVLVGVPTPQMTLELPLLDVFGRGGALKSSWYGDCLPQPRLPDADRSVPAGASGPGRVRQRDDRLEDVEASFARMHRGEVLRSVVLFQ